MKTSLPVAALLCAPEVLAVALPHIPKLSSRWYHKDELATNDAIHVKRADGQDHSHELKPKRAMPHVAVNPTTTSASSTPAGTGGAEMPSTTLGMLPRPAATLHNPYVGNHPFIGHGPVLRFPTASPTPTGYGEYNFTLTYLATGTTPPVANTTATFYPLPIYVPVINSSTNDTRSTNTISCDLVPELVDDKGNFLPEDLQPKYNGSSHCIPSNYTLVETEPDPERVMIEGHVVDNSEIVEVEVIPLPNATDTSSNWNNTADDDYGTYYGANPTAYPLPTTDTFDTTTAPPTSIGSTLPTTVSSSTPVQRQRVPTSSTPGFKGPKVRRATVPMYPELGGEEHLEGMADLLFD